MSEPSIPNRCRIVLIVPAALDGATGLSSLAAALDAGDIASLIVPSPEGDPAAAQKRAEAIVRIGQERGVAVMIADELRVAMRANADGVHFDGNAEGLADVVDRAQGRIMVGASGAKTRHEALELGEAQPDYVFFGRIGHDQKAEPHPRNLSLAEWWAEMTQIPCIVQAGSDLSGLAAAAATGAEFVALGAAIFGEGHDPAARIVEANRLLDEVAPAFESA